MLDTSIKYFLWFFGILIVLTIILNSGAKANTDAAELRKAAREAKRAAMIVDCSTIGTLYSQCLGEQDAKSCDRLKGTNGNGGSLVWFSNEYGTSPLLLCPTGDFLE